MSLFRLEKLFIFILTMIKSHQESILSIEKSLLEQISKIFANGSVNPFQSNSNRKIKSVRSLLMLKD